MGNNLGKKKHSNKNVKLLKYSSSKNQETLNENKHSENINSQNHHGKDENTKKSKALGQIPEPMTPEQVANTTSSNDPPGTNQDKETKERSTHKGKSPRITNSRNGDSANISIADKSKASIFKLSEELLSEAFEQVKQMIALGEIKMPQQPIDDQVEGQSLKTKTSSTKETAAKETGISSVKETVAEETGTSSAQETAAENPKTDHKEVDLDATGTVGQDIKESVETSKSKGNEIKWTDIININNAPDMRNSNTESDTCSEYARTQESKSERIADKLQDDDVILQFGDKLSRDILSVIIMKELSL